MAAYSLAPTKTLKIDIPAKFSPNKHFGSPPKIRSVTEIKVFCGYSAEVSAECLTLF